MQIKTSPSAIWEEYQNGVRYNESMGFYETVARNENFYIGKQWEGVYAPDLDKPVFNIMKRVITYFISMLVSDDVAAQVTPFAAQTTNKDEETARVLNDQIERAIELTKFKTVSRTILKNAAVDGEAYLYTYFDPIKKTGQQACGDICIECVDSTNVYFGNPLLADIQKQPYIVIAGRVDADKLRAQARKNGEAEADIIPDCEETQQSVNGIVPDDNNATVLLKLWRAEDGKIWFTRVTRSATVKAPTSLDIELYPLSSMHWDRMKNSYHGQAAITGLVPNQIAINKLYALYIKSVKDTAFPKIVYDMTRISRWTNRVGEAIGVYGNVGDAVAKIVPGADVSHQVPNIISSIIATTKDLMGASDAALGNVKPDNSSAIIAVQQASSIPLELQRLEFYQFIEDTVQIFIEFMRRYYGVRTISVSIDHTGNSVARRFDFRLLEDYNMKLNVDVGASTYWSELMQVQTTDNLFSKGIITDAITYLESVPEGYIKNKQKLINKLAEQKQRQEEATQ